MTTEAASQTKLLISINRANQTEIVTPYTPLIMDTTIQVLNRRSKEQQQTLSQYRGEVVP